jgi:hypothetical protein
MEKTLFEEKTKTHNVDEIIFVVIGVQNSLETEDTLVVEEIKDRISLMKLCA